MTRYKHSFGHRSYTFNGLKELLAKASVLKSGDCLAGVAASSEEERMAARFALADLPLKKFLQEEVIPYEEDEVTRLIISQHDDEAFKEIRS